jgi:flagellar biosynthesis/type III secretory pathway M-ring protein FliF/YscJ
METWRRTWSQLHELFQGMAPSQRMTLVAIPAFVLVALALVMYRGFNPAEEALLAGKVFSPDELKNAEEALRRAGAVPFRIEGSRIVVPAPDAARANAALIANDGLPDRFGDAIEKALDRNLWLVGESHRQDVIDAAKAKELVKMLKAIPEIEDARLVWQRGRKKGFSGEARMTATLGVRPKPAREISGELAQSLRQAVAAAFGMASDEDVTVLNTRTGAAPGKPRGAEAAGSAYIEQHRRFSEEFRTKIASALEWIPNVLVNVHVDLDPLIESREHERKLEPKTVPLRVREQSEAESSTQSQPAAEPGVAANQPRGQRASAAQATSRTVDKNTTSTESAPVKETETQRRSVGLTPRAVQVAVAIPAEYYRQVAAARKLDANDKAFPSKLAQIETEVKRDVEQTVARLIPAPPAGAATGGVISVVSVERQEPVAPVAAAGAASLAVEGLRQWAGPVGLALFTLWALWMLQRSARKSAAVPASGNSAPALAVPATIEMPVSAAKEAARGAVKTTSKRDMLQEMVKESPEMAASVLSRWILDPK